METSSTVGGRALGFLHGGLNYQIEHHLFPRISHVHYHKLAPIVRQWCKDYKVKYAYYPTLQSNIKSCYSYLNQLGASPSPQVGQSADSTEAHLYPVHCFTNVMMREESRLGASPSPQVG